jgi:hypothetical protein
MAELPEAQKLSHREVNYEDPSRHSGQFCAGCQHFISPRRCEHVKSPISPRAWCKKYEAK